MVTARLLHHIQVLSQANGAFHPLVRKLELTKVQRAVHARATIDLEVPVRDFVAADFEVGALEGAAVVRAFELAYVDANIVSGLKTRTITVAGLVRRGGSGGHAEG
eukprot:753585-Hanusia_phi.AAC.5